MDRDELVRKCAEQADATGRPIGLQHATPELPLVPVFYAMNSANSSLEALIVLLNAAWDFDPEATEKWLTMWLEQSPQEVTK